MKNITGLIVILACSCGNGNDTMNLGKDVAEITCMSPDEVYPRLVVNLSAKPPCPQIGTTADGQYYANPLPDGGVLCDANGCYFQGFSLVCTCAVIHEGLGL